MNRIRNFIYRIKLQSLVTEALELCKIRKFITLIRIFQHGSRRTVHRLIILIIYVIASLIRIDKGTFTPDWKLRIREPGPPVRPALGAAYEIDRPPLQLVKTFLPGVVIKLIPPAGIL